MNTKLDKFLIKNKIETPCFVYDLKKIKNNISKITKAFSNYKNFELFYAVKANNNKEILKIIIKQGISLHVSSKEELIYSLRLKPRNISYTAPIISKEILKLWKKHKFEININNSLDINYFRNNKNLGIRINPLIGWAYFGGTKAGGKFSQFGIPINEIKGKILKSVSRLHCHTSSDSYEYKLFFKQLKLLLKISSKYKNIKTINIGGGIATPITKNEHFFKINLFANRIITILDNFNKKYNRNIKLQLELGNYLVRNIGIYITKVVQVEKKFGKNYVFTDGTMHHLKGSDIDYIITPNSKKTQKKSFVIGKTCQRNDLFIKNYNLPKVKIFDNLIIEKVGAYCMSQADNFNLVPKPKEYIIKDD